MCFSREPLDIEVSWRRFTRDKFLISRDETVNNCWHGCVDHVESSCQMCVMCPHDPIACRLSRVDVLVSVFFTHRLLLFFHVLGGVAMSRWWKPS